MENILDLMKIVSEESGGVPLELSVKLNSEGQWVAKVSEDGVLLCDRQGDLFLRAISEDIEDAVETLNQLCA